MIYFDNAATGGFKPNSSLSAAENVIRNVSANPGRSGHRLSLLGEQIIDSCREELAEFFEGESSRVIFTKNCTEALNLAIFGCVKKGGKVLVSCYEHNSVLRPLYHLSKTSDVTYEVIYPTLDKPIEQLFEEKITHNVCLIICTAISNVTGEVMPIEKIGKVAKRYHIPFLIDGAQGGGHIELGLQKCNASLIALAGHKGLYGIMGSGALIVGNDVELSPIIFGGTGTETFNQNQPETYPERLESGTLNLPAIASLYEGVKYIKRNMTNFSQTLTSQTSILIEGLNKIKGVKCYSFSNPSGIVAFSIKNLPSGEVADILNSKYDVAVRGGFHCAPLTHKFLGTEDNGLVRISLAVQNTTREILYCIKCINEIANSQN